MNKRYFITSTGTGIGKSFITAALARQARALSQSVMAYKPIISGFSDADVANSDTGLLLSSLGLSFTPENIARVSPWRYAAPLAPSMAARMENNPLDFREVVSHSLRVAQQSDDVVLIEGVGGIMVPLNERRTVLDWAEAAGIPALLVVGTYLGSISHTLTGLAVLRQRHVPIAAVIVNESANSSVGFDDTVAELKNWTEAPLLPVRFRADGKPDDVTELRTLLHSA